MVFDFDFGFFPPLSSNLRHHGGQAETDQLQPFFDFYPEHAALFEVYIARAEAEAAAVAAATDASAEPKGAAAAHAMDIRDIALQKVCADAGDAMQFNV